MQIFILQCVLETLMLSGTISHILGIIKIINQQLHKTSYLFQYKQIRILSELCISIYTKVLSHKDYCDSFWPLNAFVFHSRTEPNVLRLEVCWWRFSRRSVPLGSSNFWNLKLNGNYEGYSLKALTSRNSYILISALLIKPDPELRSTAPLQTFYSCKRRKMITCVIRQISRARYAPQLLPRSVIHITM